MKILQLAPRCPFPEDDGGKIGIANITKELAKRGAEITLVYFYTEDADANPPEYAREFAEIIPIKHDTSNSLIRLIKSVLYRKSVYVEKHISFNVKAEIRKIISKRKFDIIHCDHTAMMALGQYCRKRLKCPLGLRLHNLEYTIWQRYADSLQNLSFEELYVRDQAKILKHYEKKVIGRADVSFAITNVDAELAKSMAPKGNIVIASAGVNTDDFMPDNSIERNPFEMIHATVYRWRHNINAIEWFIHEVLPILAAKNTKFTLSLLGKSAPDSLRDCSPNVVLHGYVPKVQPYLNHAGIYIAPLFVGGGIRIKILEAMAMELPVVASPIAAEGITATEADGLFIANNKDEFASHILRLSQDENLRREAGKNAREFILKNHTWKKNVGIMFDEYTKLINK